MARNCVFPWGGGEVPPPSTPDDDGTMTQINRTRLFQLVALSVYTWALLCEVRLCCREAESGSESEAGYRQRRRERHSRRSAENLTYTEEKWKSVQNRVRDGRFDG